jgi:hypothetical protein
VVAANTPVSCSSITSAAAFCSGRSVPWNITFKDWPWQRWSSTTGVILKSRHNDSAPLTVM